MQLANIGVEFPPGEVTFEMSDLSPREAGLDFAVFVSPKMASHAARIKVTQPPWGSKPEAVYTLSPFGLAAQERWLSSRQEARIREWVAANLAVLLAYWDGDIVYDQDVRSKLVTVGTGGATGQRPRRRRAATAFGSSESLVSALDDLFRSIGRITLKGL